MIAGPPVLCELYAGTAAVSRWCLGLRLGLVAYLGAKVRVAGELACALELGDRPALGGLLLCDAGPWGWVWPALLDEPTRAAVAAVLRRWASTCPACEGSAEGCPVCVRAKHPGGGPDASDLWAWLASQPPRADLVEYVCQQLWLQARSASGAAVWWDEIRWATIRDAAGRAKVAGERNSGWRKGQSAGRPDTHVGQMGRGPGGQWLTQKGAGGAQAPRERDTLRSPTAAPPGPPRRARGIVRTETLAERVELLGGAAWPSGDPAFGELIASWLVLQTGSARGRPVELQDHGWRTYGFAHLSRGAVARGFTSRLHLPRVAGRVEALAGAPWPSTAVLHGRVQEAFWLARELGPRARVLLDPPYHRDGDQDRDRTGYGQDCPLSETLAMADELARARARVVICEGGPLAGDLGPGWRSYDLTSRYSGVVKGREWITVNGAVDLSPVDVRPEDRRQARRSPGSAQARQRVGSGPR